MNAMMSQAYLVFCTCPTLESAQQLATALVAEKLAACVNILPGLTSVYYWQQEVKIEAEQLLLCKTTDSAYPLLQQYLTKHHPYEVPEILAVPIAAGLPSYITWLTTNVGNGEPT
jgi:periplasmic divalent cation tolerance protein